MAPSSRPYKGLRKLKRLRKNADELLEGLKPDLLVGFALGLKPQPPKGRDDRASRTREMEMAVCVEASASGSGEFDAESRCD